MGPSLRDKLYIRNPECLHTENYLIYLKQTGVTLCGPCFFRDGFITELPPRVTIRREDLHGKAFDPTFINHLSVSVGLVPPEPGQSLSEFKAQRSRRSQPNRKQFPFISALWELMGYQPPLARVLVKFCEGFREVEIADQLELSLYNVTDRLTKSVHVGQKMLRI
jgi:hypothetical protein